MMLLPATLRFIAHSFCPLRGGFKVYADPMVEARFAAAELCAVFESNPGR
jgi:hypothetical protein